MGNLTAEEIVAKINSGATKLNLRLTQQQQHFSFSHPQITDTGIGDEGVKTICEALKSNTSLKGLYLTMAQQQRFSFPHSQITGNEIGAEGCKAIGEALKSNTSLTKLDLEMTQHQQHFSFSHP